jgi:hypothetical protein
MITLTRNMLSAILVNTVHEIDMGEGRIAVITYQDGDRAQMRLPDGQKRTGAWQLLDDGYAVQWENGPSATWQLKADVGQIAYFDTDGTNRGFIRSIAYAEAKNVSLSGQAN